MQLAVGPTLGGRQTMPFGAGFRVDLLASRRLSRIPMVHWLCIACPKKTPVIHPIPLPQHRPALRLSYITRARYRGDLYPSQSIIPVTLSCPLSPMSYGTSLTSIVSGQPTHHVYQVFMFARWIDDGPGNGQLSNQSRNFVFILPQGHLSTRETMELG